MIETAREELFEYYFRASLPLSTDAAAAHDDRQAGNL